MSGQTELRITAVGEPLATVVLQAVGLTVQRTRASSGEILAYQYDGRQLSIRLSAPLEVGQETGVVVDYKAVRPPAGVYFPSSPSVVWTQGRLVDNHFWLPTVDDPAMRTQWDIFVRTPGDERAFATGELIDQHATDDGIEWHWRELRPIPSQYVTIVVGPYTVIDALAGTTSVHSWTYRGSGPTAAFGMTPRIVETLSKRLEAPFPTASFNQIVVPDYIFWEWLENWRPLVTTTVLDDRLMLRAGQGWPGEDAEQGIARGVAQEWFGKSLGPGNWADLWLSDGLSNFLAQVYAEESGPPQAAAKIREWSYIGATTSDRDARRPLVFDRWRYGPLELLMTQHVVQKGTAVLHMLRHELGDSAFWRGIHLFVVRYAGQAVSTADFQRTMEEATGQSLETFFSQWVYGSGYPKLQIAQSYDSTTRQFSLTVRQVQPRDTLTGFFDALVDVAIGTPSGVLKKRVALHGETTDWHLALDEAPLWVEWDPEKWLLSDVEFPKTTDQLIGQLQHAQDYAGRIDAARALVARGRGMEGQGSWGWSAGNEPPVASPEALRAVLDAVRSKSLSDLRPGLAETLAGAFDAESRQALLDLTHDSSAAARAMSALALFPTHAPNALSRLQAMAAGDSDPNVREIAAKNLSMMGMGGPADAAARATLTDPAASDEAKAQAVAELTGARSAAAWTLGKKYLSDPASSRAVRQAAMRQMGINAHYHFMREAKADELVPLLTPLLNADDPSMRIASARELGSASTPAAEAALKARKPLEVDVRVLLAIDSALEEIAKGDDLPVRRGENDP